MEEKNEQNEKPPIFKLGNITERRDINLKLSDRDNILDISHLTQNPEDVLFPPKKDNNNFCIKKTNSKMTLETFRTMFRNKNKELKEYNETLDKKIEFLWNKIMKKKSNEIQNKNINTNDINILKGKNQENKEYPSEIFIESTLKENTTVDNNLIDEIKAKKNFEDSIFSLKKGDRINYNSKDYDDTFDLNIKKIISINYNLFNNTFYKNKYHAKNFYTLLSLLNNNDLYKLFNINRITRNKIIEILKNKIKENIIPKFITKYCDDNLFIKDSHKFSIVTKLYKKNKKAFIRMVLSIKAKISEKNIYIINKKHQILYQILYPDNLKNSIFTSYSFEIIPKPIPKKFWVYKEYTSYHYDDFDKAYYNDLLQFWPGDEILISIGLINELGFLDFQNFHWLNPKIVPKINKEKISNILCDSYLTNSENTCEVEGLVHTWIGIEQLDNNINVISTLKQLFGNYFNINEVYYEDIGYYFFKIILQAKKEGICGGINNNLGINIKIYDKDKHICNEIKKNGLIYDENNELSIHINDIITFYISQNK